MLLETAGLTKRFGGVIAVDGVDLAVAPGQVFGLIGPNGAGKTTLINLLSGQLRADAGAVRLGGADVTALPAHLLTRRGLARTFQGVRLFKGLTVLENVLVGRHVRMRSDVLARLVPFRAAGTADRAAAVRHRGIGSVFEHVLADDRTRGSYRQTLSTENADAVADFLERGLAHFAALGVSVRQLMSDNAFSYIHGRRFATILAGHGITHITIPPYTPRWNGKAEAFIKILLGEAAYARPYRSDAARERAFRRFDHEYNFTRRHGEIGGLTPMQRLADDLLNNVRGQNS